VTDFAAFFIGGIGFFLLGMRMMSESLSRLSGRRVRQFLVYWTARPLQAMLCGAAMTATTQSSSATTFILVGMVKANLIPLKRVFIVIVGSNFGGIVMMTFASIDVRLAVLAAAGMAGIIVARGRSERMRDIGSAILGVCFIFLGISFIREGALPLTQEPWFAQLMADTGRQYFLGFVFAAVFAFVVQSSLAVSLLAMTLAGTGVLPEEQAVMIVYGSMVGSSGATALLAQGLEGAARQVAMFQTAFNLVGAAIVVPLFYLEVYGGVPAVLALIDLAGLGVTQNILLAFVAFDVIAAAAMVALLRPLSRGLEYLWPQDADAETRLRFIHDQALADPLTALYLTRQEQTRLIAMLTRPMALVRAGNGPQTEAALRQRHAAFLSLDKQIAEFLNELSGSIQGSEAFEELNRILKLQRAIDGVERSLLDLAVTLARLLATDSLGSLPASIIEGVDTVALVLQDIATDGAEPYSLKVLAQITEDADGVMRKVRQYYLTSETGSAQAQRMTLLRLTNLTERVIWQMGEMGQFLPHEPH
jgi:phosphate:Na+ symporter